MRGVRTWGGEVEGAVVEAAGEGEDEGLHFLRVETGFECEGVLERRVGGWVDGWMGIEASAFSMAWLGEYEGSSDPPTHLPTYLGGEEVLP